MFIAHPKSRTCDRRPRRAPGFGKLRWSGPAGLSFPAGKADNPVMLSRRVLKVLSVVLWVASGSPAVWAAKDFVMPRPENASTYPSRDIHSNEKVAAAVELYNAPPKSDIFNTPFIQDGILPVFLVITNNGDRPVALTQLHAELVTSSRAKLEGLTTDDVFRRVAHVSGDSTNPGRVSPIPLPGGNKNKKSQKAYSEIMAASFAAQAVEPHTTKAGFLFFDVMDVKQWQLGSHIYLTGIRDAGGNELMYFDIAVIQSNAAAASGAQ